MKARYERSMGDIVVAEEDDDTRVDVFESSIGLDGIGVAFDVNTLRFS